MVPLNPRFVFDHVGMGGRACGHPVVLQQDFCTIGTNDVIAVSVALSGQGYSEVCPGGSDPVPNQKKPTESSRDAPVERRGQPRGDMESTDWETIVLKRVERHVESLSAGADAQQDPQNEPGWEETALLALRRRIRDLKAE